MSPLPVIKDTALPSPSHAIAESCGERRGSKRSTHTRVHSPQLFVFLLKKAQLDAVGACACAEGKIKAATVKPPSSKQRRWGVGERASRCYMSQLSNVHPPRVKQKKLSKERTEVKSERTLPPSPNSQPVTSGVACCCQRALGVWWQWAAAQWPCGGAQPLRAAAAHAAE